MAGPVDTKVYNCQRQILCMIFRCFKNPVRIFHTLFRWRINAFQLIRDSQFFPFIYTKCMIWKNLNFLYVIKCFYKVMKSVQILVFIASFRNQDVTDPDWFSGIRKILAISRIFLFVCPVRILCCSSSICLISSITRSVTFISSWNLLKNGSSLVNGFPQVSSVVLIPLSLAFWNNSSRKSICRSGSPPLTVIPPLLP